MKKYLKYVLISLFFITLTSKLSPIYSVNDWCDTNAFFTVGKAMMRGLTVYKDIIEQKGPLLYLIYGIGYLISNTSFLGVYILEIISFSIFMKIVDDIIKTIDKNGKYALPIIAFLITTTTCFKCGGSAEEFCFPFIAYNFLLLIKLIKQEKITNKQIFINGLLCGCVFIIKFNLVSYWIPFMILLLREKNKIKKTTIFLTGSSLPFIISITYFAFKKGLIEYIDAYFLVNIFKYNTMRINYIDNIIDSIVYIIITDIKLVLLIIIGSIYALKQKKLKEYLIIILIPLYFTCFQNICMEYYPLPIYILLIPIIVYILNKIKIEKINYHIFIVLIIIGTLTFGKSINAIKYKKEEYAQHKFSEIINQYEDKTLLIYNVIDGGFYLETNTVPNVKYYHRMNIPNHDEMNNSINRYVEEKKTNFIIYGKVKNEFESINKILEKDYKLLMIEKNNRDEGLYYALYVRK